MKEGWICDYCGKRNKPEVEFCVCEYEYRELDFSVPARPRIKEVEGRRPHGPMAHERNVGLS